MKAIMPFFLLFRLAWRHKPPNPPARQS